LAKNKAYLAEVHNYANQLKALSKKEVVVGIPAKKNKKHDDSPFTVAEIGAVHEFGSPSAGIPQRSFLRVPLSENVKQLFKALDKDLKFSKINTNKALGKLGAKGQSIVLEAFKTQNKGRWEVLKPATISNRLQGSGTGSTKPLIDTGQLRQSITFEVRDI